MAKSIIVRCFLIFLTLCLVTPARADEWWAWSALEYWRSDTSKAWIFLGNRLDADDGAYAHGPTPCGLTICDGKEQVPVNLADGEGNFFLKPNGVFYLDDVTGPGIVEAGEFVVRSSGRSLNPQPGLKPELRTPRFAIQSGPLLLRKGVIHPAFRENSPNLRQRSAVGIVAKTQEIVFVMSDREDRVKGRVTFHQLARLFLHLGCQDALYLDGDISQMITSPPPGTKFTPNTFAGMFVVAE